MQKTRRSSLLICIVTDIDTEFSKRQGKIN